MSWLSEKVESGWKCSDENEAEGHLISCSSLEAGAANTSHSMHEIQRARATKYNPFQREIQMQLRKKRPEEVVVLIGRWQRGAVEMICSPVAEEFDSGGACQRVSDNLFYFTMQPLRDCNIWNGRITDNLFYFTLLQKNEILNKKSDPSTYLHCTHFLGNAISTKLYCLMLFFLVQTYFSWFM